MQFFKIRSKNFFHYSAVLMQICQKCFHSLSQHFAKCEKNCKQDVRTNFLSFSYDGLNMYQRKFVFCLVAASMMNDQMNDVLSFSFISSFKSIITILSNVFENLKATLRSFQLFGKFVFLQSRNELKFKTKFILNYISKLNLNA